MRSQQNEASVIHPIVRWFPRKPGSKQSMGEVTLLGGLIGHVFIDRKPGKPALARTENLRGDSRNGLDVDWLLKRALCV